MLPRLRATGPLFSPESSSLWIRPMDTEFYRIKRLPPYVFEEVNRMKAQARARGEDIIDFGMGNPDNPTPPHIVAKLDEAAQNPRAQRYSSSRGENGRASGRDRVCKSG